MEYKPFFDKMLAHMDALDARGFASSFTEGGILRLANNEPVVGRDRIENDMAGFCSAIGGLRHDFQNCWALEDRAFANGLVTYLRKDGSTLTVPWATIARFEGGKLAEYDVYVDSSKLFNP